MHPVAILAGGLGTRLRDVTNDRIPKVLVPVNGRPFIDYKLAGLARDGVRDVVLLVGALGDQIRSHVEGGERFGLRVRYLDDGPDLLGTGGAVAAALSLLPDSFWVTYGDTFLQFKMEAAERTFADSSWLGLMTVLRNEDRWQPSNVRVEGGVVASYSRAPNPLTHAFIDYGITLMRRAAFDGFARGEPFDLADVFRRLIEGGALGAFEVTERFRTIGTPEELSETEDYFAATSFLE